MMSDNIGRLRFVSLFVFLLCLLTPKYSQGSRKLAQTITILDYGVFSDFEAIVAALPPKEKEIVSDCLREKRLTSHVSKPVDEDSWLNKYQHLLPGWSYGPRRYLSDGRIISPIQSPALSPYSLVPAPSPTPSSSTVFQAPNLAFEPPTPVPEKSPSPNERSIEPPSPTGDGYISVITKSSEKDSKNRNYIVAGIVSGVVVGVSLFAFVLFCCVKGKKGKVESEDRSKDEKPLLKLTSNNSLAVNTTFQGSSKDESHTLEVGGETSENNESVLPLQVGRQPPPPPVPPRPPPKPPVPPPKFSPPPKPPAPKPPPLGPRSNGGDVDVSEESDAPKTKLKPFFWDKVMASPDQSMVWHDLKAGSFQFNEEMMETLFGYAIPEKNKNENKKESSSFEARQFIQIIDSKKSQNLAILLKALNITTEEVRDALIEGNELPPELIQTLIKMAPTSEEEQKLKLYNGDVSHLGPAERFLKVIVEIPFAFKRLESLLFMSTYQEQISPIKESLSTLEVACEELRNNRLFLKLLEAVLKTGNRMNDGTYRGGALAFKLDTLLKLSDVKGTDGKTTLLHFVVHEIIRSEGLRAARMLSQSQSMPTVKTKDLIEDASYEKEEYYRNLGLQAIAGLSDELSNVRKAALIDSETVAASVIKLGQSLVSLKGFLEHEMQSLDGESEFYHSLASFIEHADSEIKRLIEEDKRIMDLVKSTRDYFHGRARNEEGPRLFAVIRDFLLMLDKACKDVKTLTHLSPKAPKTEHVRSLPTQETRKESLRDYHMRLFPSIKRRESDDDDEFSSSDNES